MQVPAPLNEHTIGSATKNNIMEEPATMNGHTIGCRTENEQIQAPATLNEQTIGSATKNKLATMDGHTIGDTIENHHTQEPETLNGQSIGSATHNNQNKERPTINGQILGSAAQAEDPLEPETINRRALRPAITTNRQDEVRQRNETRTRHRRSVRFQDAPTPETVFQIPSWKWLLSILVVLFSSYVSLLYVKSNPGRAIAHQIKIIQKSLCENFYKEQLGMVNLEPWKEGDKDSENVRLIQEVYINQVFYTDKKRHTSLLHFFTTKPKEYPYRGVLVAEQGAGKTTAVKALAAEWCRIITSEPKYGVILEFKYAIDQLYNHGWIWFSWHTVVGWWPTVIGIVEYLPLMGVVDFYLGRGTFLQTLDYMKHKPHPLPELVFAFELRNIYEYRNLTEAIVREMLSIDRNIMEGEIERILEKGMKNILLVFDGYDEYTKLKMKGSTMPEVDAIIRREHRKNINLIVTTRSWRSDELLNIIRFGFEKVSVAPFELPKDRDAFIGHFFPGGSGEKLINALDYSDEDIIPQQLQREPRMLLYICNLWKYSKEMRQSRLRDQDMFWDEIWELMRLTYNRKYPQQEMSKEALQFTRRKIGLLVLQNRGKEMSFQHFFDEFGDELGADLFWFGIYGTETLAEKPWKLLDNDSGVKKSKDVKVNYESMLDQEAEKIKMEGSGFLGWIVNAILSVWNMFCYVISFCNIF